MNRLFTVLLVACTLSFVLISPVRADTGEKLESLPAITLSVPEKKAHISYLGLKGQPGTTFSLSDIDADLLVIELFSMYCPYCQKAAPAVNELYELLEKRKGPGLKSVIIGIGANNTDLEVDTFREGFSIEFPLFADPDLSIYRTLVGLGTPTFIAAKKNDAGKMVIFFRKKGGFTDATALVEQLLSRAQLKADGNEK